MSTLYVSDGYFQYGYIQSGITIDWANKNIYVPKGEMTLIQITPIEVRELNLDTFRLALKELEDSSEGIVYDTTHSHVAPISVGGVQLARIIEIINDYTITFEDGQYAVNLVGANSNVADRVNVNQVSVRSANSAGLVQTREIEQSSYNGRVVIDTVSGVAGVSYPIGTLQRPVNNLSDAQFIMSQRGLDSILVIGSLTINAGENVSNLNIYGLGATFNVQKTKITLVSGCITSNTHWHDLRIDGEQGGESNYDTCYIGALTNANCYYNNCKMVGPVQFTANIFSTHTTDIVDCHSGINEYVVDQNGSQLKQVYTDWTGKIRFTNGTHANSIIEINMLAGTVTIDASVTAGTYKITGVGKVINNSVGATVDATALNLDSVSTSIWDHIKALSIPKFLGLK